MRSSNMLLFLIVTQHTRMIHTNRFENPFKVSGRSSFQGEGKDAALIIFKYGKVYSMRPAVHIAAIIKAITENNLNISDF